MHGNQGLLATVLVLSLAGMSATPEGAVARPDSPKLADIVKIEFPEGGYSYTLAEAAKGIKIEYKVIVADDVEGVIPHKSAPSYREPAGPSGLHPREQISGGEQLYALRDFGLGAPPKDEARKIKKGTFTHVLEWDGRNWSGPSDFNNPKGKPFPAGTYEVTIALKGEVVSEKGKVPYEITRKAKLVLK
jgi:hypothetical protein